jgi:hypothetical protein
MLNRILLAGTSLALIATLAGCISAEDLERKTKAEQLANSTLGMCIRQLEISLTPPQKIYYSWPPEQISPGFINPKDISVEMADLNDNGLAEWYIMYGGNSYAFNIKNGALSLVEINPSSVDFSPLGKSEFDEARMLARDKGYGATGDEKRDLYHMMEYGFIDPRQVRFHSPDNNHAPHSKMEVIHTPNGSFSGSHETTRYRLTESSSGKLKLIKSKQYVMKTDN